MDRREFIGGLAGILIGGYLGIKPNDVEAANDLTQEIYVSYNPTNYNPNISQYPSSDSIKKDLDTLVNAGFTGLITFGANDGLKNIPRYAKEAGMKEVIMGIWDIHASVIDSGMQSTQIEEDKRQRMKIDTYNPRGENLDSMKQKIIYVVDSKGNEIPLNQLLKSSQEIGISKFISQHSLTLFQQQRPHLQSTSGGNEEWENALAAKSYVDGYCAGNEGLYVSGNGGYTFDELVAYHDALRNATGKPVTSSEVDPHYDQQWVLDNGDMLLPNIHPFWGGIRNAQDGVTMVNSRYNFLKSKIGFRPILLKETGFPTAGDSSVNETLQKDFYQQLQNTNVNFSFFEAYDQPWKDWNPVEPHWGLWDKKRNPKPVVSIIRKKKSAVGNSWGKY